MSELFDDADRLFVAAQSFSEAEAEAKTHTFVGLPELYALATDPAFDDARGVLEAVNATPRLKKDFDRLQRDLALVSVPERAAASSDQGLSERDFPGGSLSLVPARRGQQVYLTITLDPPVPVGPFLIVLKDPDGTFFRLPVSAADSEGVVFVVLDSSEPEVARAITALRSPMGSAQIISVQGDRSGS